MAHSNTSDSSESVDDQQHRLSTEHVVDTNGEAVDVRVDGKEPVVSVDRKQGADELVVQVYDPSTQQPLAGVEVDAAVDRLGQVEGEDTKEGKNVEASER